MSSVLDFIIDSVDRRLFQIEQEVDLIDAQMKILDTIGGIGKNQIDVLICKYQILIVFHSILTSYVTSIKQNRITPCPFKTAVSCHLLVMKTLKEEFEQRLREIEERQQALYDLITEGSPGEQSLEKKSLEKRGETVEDLMSYLSKFFPYRFVFELLSDGSFFGDFLKIILNFSPSPTDSIKRYKQCLKATYELIKPHCQVGKDDTIQIVAIAEMFVSFFLKSTFMSNEGNNIENFQFGESCRLLVSNSLKDLNIPEQYMERMHRSGSRDSDLDKVSFTFKKIENRVKRPMEYEKDSKSVLPCMRHVILELRKLTTQVSVSMMHFILWQAMGWLNATLSVDGEVVGADESFQFFVAALSEAKLLKLPAIVSVLQKYVVDDLRTSKTTFLVTQLGIAQEFIRTRKMTVPPYILLPFRDGASQGLERVDDTEIELTGFAVYAFPTFRERTYPATVCCTGDPNDVAILYKFKHPLTFGSGTEPAFEISATLDGLLTHISVDEANKHGLIKIDEPEILKKSNFLEEIALFSNLMLMCKQQLLLKCPRLSQIGLLEEQYSRTWRQCSDRAEMKRLITESIRDMQNALKEKEVLTADFVPSGVIDAETVDAIRKVIPQFKRGDFFIDPRIRSFICHKRQK